MPASPPRYRKGDTIAGRYLVHQALQGGMGEVYLCLKLDENLPVALKTFQQRYLNHPAMRRLFHEEVATWVALEKHPNIVRCFWMEILDNQPFMALEWVAGEEGRGTDLRSWLRRGALDLRLALDFIIDICRGLIYAQEKQPGMVHRDLKPDNILVSQGHLAKITDFGLAMVAQRANLDLASDDAADTGSHQHTRRIGAVVGTPPYMAPEQWRGEAVDARTDIYAIGCILYELLTGQFPYTATTMSEFRQQHEAAALPTLPSDQNLPPALNGVLAGCLAKRSEERFPNVTTLLEAVTTLYKQQVSAELRPMPIAGILSAMDYSNRGNTYHNLGRYDEALVDHNRAVEMEPITTVVFLNRGLTYDSMKRYDEALIDYTRAIEIDADLVLAYTNRGVAYHNQGNYNAALADYAYALTLDCYDAAIYLNRGNTYHKLKHYNEALANFSHAIELDPNLATAYTNRGRTYADMGQYDSALSNYRHAIELDPTNADIYTDRGNTYVELELYNDALNDFTRAIKLDPTNARAYTNRGSTYLKLGHSMDALADFTHAIALDLAYALAYTNRGVVYKNLRRYDAALADHTRAIEIDPFEVSAYTNRGIAYDALGRYDAALADYTRAIELAPNDAPAYYNRGTLYHDQGHTDAALADYTRAIEIVPTYVKAYINRGSIYDDMERLEEALADFTRAIALDPTVSQAYTNIGVLLAKQGKLHEALPYFENAAKLGDANGTKGLVLVRRMLGM